MNLTAPITDQQLELLEKRAEEFANDLFNDHYHAIMTETLDDYSDLQEEIVVSLLAIKHSKITVNKMIEIKKSLFLLKVLKYLELL